MEIRICRYFALAAAALGLPAIAAAQSFSPGGARIVLRTGVRCHEAPGGPTSASSLHAGRIIDNAPVRFGPPIWYAAGPCWIPGEATAPFDARHPEIGYSAVVEDLLSRKDTVPFSQYVEVQNMLEAVPSPGSGSLSMLDRYPLLQFRSLQLINRALQLVRWRTNSDAPLTEAWLAAHKHLLEYGEPSAIWQVTARSYWDIFDKHPHEPWSEELAWTAAQYVRDGDECDADCFLGVIRSGPEQYWIRMPHGAHVPQALAKADTLAASALKDGVPEGAPTLPAIESVRESLSAVTAPGRAHLLALLAELQQKAEPRRP